MGLDPWQRRWKRWRQCRQLPRGQGNGSGPEVFEADQYFYHPDHLGSSSYVTDVGGEIFQHLEYCPFGETWFEESSNTQRTPYLFTGKELDEETGLYYFGARYYDPRTSVWQSPDPILATYLQGQASGQGVYTPPNLNLYGYADNRPIVRYDPDGRQDMGMAHFMRGYNLAHQYADRDDMTLADKQAAVMMDIARQDAIQALPLAIYGAPIALSYFASTAPTAYMLALEIGVAEATGMITIAGAGAAASSKVLFDSNKFRYIFGNVTSGRHNSARSTQLGVQMRQAGIWNNQAGRDTILRHVGGLLENNQSVVSVGYREGSDGVRRLFERREGILFGPNGAFKSQVDFLVNPDGTRTFNSIQLFGTANRFDE